MARGVASCPVGTGTGVCCGAAAAAAVVPGFSGRAKAFKELTALLEGGSRLAVVCGIPGVGKTALAVQWAHQVASRFPGSVRVRPNVFPGERLGATLGRC